MTIKHSFKLANIIFNAYPRSNGASPANYAWLKPCMWFTPWPFEKSGPLNTRTILHNDIWSNDHVRSNSTPLANLSTWILQHE